MRGAVFAGDRTVELRNFPEPIPGLGDAIVRIRASGLCGSDLHRYRAGESSNIVTGHEPCGEVAALGEGTSTPRVGERVVVYHYSGCGECEHCVVGWEQLCVTGKHKVYGGGGIDGGNAEY